MYNCCDPGDFSTLQPRGLNSVWDAETVGSAIPLSKRSLVRNDVRNKYRYDSLSTLCFWVLLSCFDYKFHHVSKESRCSPPQRSKTTLAGYCFFVHTAKFFCFDTLSPPFFIFSCIVILSSKFRFLDPLILVIFTFSVLSLETIPLNGQ